MLALGPAAAADSGGLDAASNIDAIYIGIAAGLVSDWVASLFSVPSAVLPNCI